MDSGPLPGKPVLLLPKPHLWLPSQLPLLAPSAAALFVLFDFRLLPSKSDLKSLVLTEAPTFGKLPLLGFFWEIAALPETRVNWAGSATVLQTSC